MKQIISFVLLAVTMAGCAGPESAWQPSPDKIEVAAEPVTAPESARVTQVSMEHGYVVMDYGAQAVPAIGTSVDLFRGGEKIGRVRLTEPARGTFITGDILEGEPRTGDVAR